VSRITVRRAVSSLEQEGLILRKRGKGSFVLAKTKSLESPKLSGFIEDIISMGIKTKIKIIDISWVSPSDNVKQSLKASEDEMFLRIEKIRYIQENTFSHVLNYIPENIGKKIPQELLKDKSLLMILEDEMGITADRAVQTIEATIADAQLATLLQVRFGEPLLSVERTVYDQINKPIEYVSVHYRADKYFYTAFLKRKKTKYAAGWNPIQPSVD
jgi:GntR family transcriptional regulator